MLGMHQRSDLSAEDDLVLRKSFLEELIDRDHWLQVEDINQQSIGRLYKPVVTLGKQVKPPFTDIVPDECGVAKQTVMNDWKEDQWNTLHHHVLLGLLATWCHDFHVRQALSELDSSQLLFQFLVVVLDVT